MSVEVPEKFPSGLGNGGRCGAAEQPFRHDTMPRDNVFDVTMVRDMTYRRVHYPSYHVMRDHVGTSSSLEGAEMLMWQMIGLFGDIHHFNVREVPMECVTHTGECLREWLYDREGSLIDCRLIPNMNHRNEVYTGRTPEQIRFAEGDIVEFQIGDEIRLGFVVGLPPTAEKAAGINRKIAPFTMDSSDDSYVILTEEDYRSHDHVDSLMVFSPQFRIHPNVERRLRTAYQNYVTSDMRSRIAMTTAVERIRRAMAEAGLECSVAPIFYEEVCVTVSDLPEKGKSTAFRFDARKAFNHLDRVLLTICRYAGRPKPGRGYSLHRIAENEQADGEQSFELK